MLDHFIAKFSGNFPLGGVGWGGGRAASLMTETAFAGETRKNMGN